MRVIAKQTLVKFWARYPDAAQQLMAWHQAARKANWTNSADVKASYRKASIINNERVVFNIAGNKYRLIVAINYVNQVVFIKFIGTHRDYDKVDAATVDQFKNRSHT